MLNINLQKAKHYVNAIELEKAETKLYDIVRSKYQFNEVGFHFLFEFNGYVYLNLKGNFTLANMDAEVLFNCREMSIKQIKENLIK
jgi:hypothetical protein